jgi:predicted nucleotidyltransferase
MPPTTGAGKLDALLVPPDVWRGVEEFIQQVAAAYGDNLLSIVAFGCAVTGEDDAGESDVNLLVVHAPIDIEDLECVGDLSRR